MKIELILGGITRNLHLSKEYPTAEEAADGLAKMIYDVSRVAPTFSIIGIKINDKEFPLSANETITINMADYE